MQKYIILSKLQKKRKITSEIKSIFTSLTQYVPASFVNFLFSSPFLNYQVSPCQCIVPSYARNAKYLLKQHKRFRLQDRHYLEEKVFTILRLGKKCRNRSVLARPRKHRGNLNPSMAIVNY